MKTEINKTMIGAFIVGALVLAVVGILAVGGGGLFRDSERYDLYFSGSVKGLQVGAPVQLKGVPIGQVVHLNLVYSERDSTFFTHVIIDIPVGAVQTIEVGGNTEKSGRPIDDENLVNNLIKAGLRAKLVLQSFLTGQLIVAFDFYPDSEIIIRNLESEYQELPTLPSDMEALTKTLDGLDFQEIVESIKNAATGIDRLANSPDLHEAARTANDTLKQYRQLAVNLNGRVTELSGALDVTLADVRKLMNATTSQIDPVAEGITGTTDDLRAAVADMNNRLAPILENLDEATGAAKSALEQAEVLMTNLSYLADEDSAMVYQVNETLSELQQAARALQVLTDYLARHPDALLKGKSTEEEGQ